LKRKTIKYKRDGGEKPVRGGTLFLHLSGLLNQKYGIDRTSNAIKNYWYRELRARSGIDERADFRDAGRRQDYLGTSLAVSLSGGKKKASGDKKKAAAVASSSAN
jgi:hypothetical protein